jgi:hypothetical protein
MMLSISVPDLIAGAEPLAESALAGRPLRSALPRADRRVSAVVGCAERTIRPFASDHDHSVDTAPATVAKESSRRAARDDSFRRDVGIAMLAIRP